MSEFSAFLSYLTLRQSSGISTALPGVFMTLPDSGLFVSAPSLCASFRVCSFLCI